MKFKILGIGHANLGREIGIGETLSEEEHKSLYSENNHYRRGNLCYRDSSGKLQIPYTRLIIQRIK